MNSSTKRVREVVGFTFSKVQSEPENWKKLAREFKDTAVLIARTHEPSLPIPYYYNAALSLELLLKATAVAQGKPYKTNHSLDELCKLVGLKVTKDQECTLELLSEVLVWRGRYPAPKREEDWDNFHDVVLEKHKVREGQGNVGRTAKNEKRFPTMKNYLAIWNVFEKEYSLLVSNEA